MQTCGFYNLKISINSRQNNSEHNSSAFKSSIRKVRHVSGMILEVVVVECVKEAIGFSFSLRICLLAQGRTAYYGKRENAVPFFAR
jgi:hypothetical protein